jgi:hypothetical protein
MKTRPYRPANGTEGMIFDDAWCSRCQHDAAWREDNESGKPCEILNRTLIFDSDQPEYPTEWVEDDVPYKAGFATVQDWFDHTNPRCTAFLAIEVEGSTYVKDERQGELTL